ncbi:MAG: glycoside hydrolase family 43 protein [Lachnospiraceae bacterium]|nr:glycoside hydrolase family 43 protein [Lachnospiraceae bacterium]
MRKKFLGLVLTAALCTCVACTGDNQTGDNQTNENTVTSGAEMTPEVTEEPEATPEPDNGASQSMTEGRITVTMTTDKSSYAAGEEVHYTLKVENNRELYVLGETEISYKNTNGLNAANSLSMPDSLPELIAGESYELRGTLVGDVSVFPVTGEVPASQYAEKAEFDPYGGTKSDKKVSIIKTNETVTVRPFVKFMYGGQEVMIRAVIDFELGLEKEKYALSEHVGIKRTTCHDPSIFKDFDGTYYIFGTHMTLSSTNNLRDWTNMDNAWRTSFTTEVREQIRAWNKDSGAWYSYLWAPDIIYNEAMGKYCIYLSANGDTWKSNIVLLTSDVVTGPYEYAGSVVAGGFDETNWTEMDADEVLGVTELPERYIKNGVVNGKWGDEFPNCIDPTIFYDDDGNLWMAYGSWSGGIFILALDEQTGLRDYSVTYETNEHSDAYFGKKIAGGKYVSGEAAYIEKIGDYYWLHISYGGLEAKAGYNVRVYRSENPDGPYVDALGNSALFDKYSMNFNQVNKGVRLFGGYQWRTFSQGEVAQGHNSTFVDDDGRAYIVYHTRTTDGTEGHSVRVHQLFLNKENWLVAAPYHTADEKLDSSVCTVENIAGKYQVILHELDIDYANLDVMLPEAIYLNADGTVTGYYEGSWTLEEGTSYINVTLGEVTYSGVALEMNIENLNRKTMVFTALGKENQLTLWGSKMTE